MKEENHRKLFRRLEILLFVVYLAMLCYFLFFAESLGRNFSERTYHYNLKLFKEIKRFWVHRASLGAWSVGLNLIGNVVAFLPMGAFLPLLSVRCQRLLPDILLCFEFSLLVEFVQLIGKVGSFDVDDILLNTLGGILGYAIYGLFLKRARCSTGQISQSGGKNEKKKSL